MGAKNRVAKLTSRKAEVSYNSRNRRDHHCGHPGRNECARVTEDLDPETTSANVGRKGCYGRHENPTTKKDYNGKTEVDRRVRELTWPLFRLSFPSTRIRSTSSNNASRNSSGKTHQPHEEIAMRKHQANRKRRQVHSLDGLPTSSIPQKHVGTQL